MSEEIPAGLARVPALEAARRLAAAGFHVFRLHPASKRPLINEHWSQISTTDLSVITEWFGGDREFSVGLDLARSGLMAVDVDKPDLLPDSLSEILLADRTAFQSTRSNIPGRGHHVYRLPAGASYGSGWPQGWNTGWGELKAHRTYIALGPVHAKTG